MLLLLPTLLATLALAGEPPPPPGALWQARKAEYTLQRQEDGSFLLDGTVELGALDPEAAVLPWLTGEGLVIEGTGGVAAVTATRLELVLPGTATRAVATVRARIAPSEGALTVHLGVTAPLQRVRVDAPGFDITIDDARGGALRGNLLVVHTAPQVERTAEPETALALGEVAAAAWGTDDGAVASRARLRWRVVRGEMDTFRVDVGALEEVELTGPNVASWSRSGRIVTVRAKAPVRAGFVVDIEGRRATPTGNFPLPAPVPLDVSRVDRWWTLGRAAEGELTPQSAPAGVAGRTLPEWARGLSDTPPLAFWHGNADVTLRSSRYTALMGPDTVVETARFVLATNDDGRLLLRATWQVRNERSQYLHVIPGAGWRPMTARVTGDPVSVLSDGSGGVYVPLEKSIETLQGLLTFPVEVTWIVDDAAWERRGTYAFALPAVDAPIQRADWEVHLPRGYERIGVRDEGRRGRPDFGPVLFGKKSGSGSGDGDGFTDAEGDWDEDAEMEEEGRDANQERLDAAEAAMSNATRAYQKNDFETAQQWLATAKEAAPEDQNVDRLQSNLDVLLGGVASDDSGARRVRDLANAKTIDAQNEQAKVEEKASEALRKGDDQAALGYLAQASQLSSSIAVTEQRESGEQQDKAEAYKAKVDVAKKQIEARASTVTAVEKPTPVSGSVSGIFVVDGKVSRDSRSGGGEATVDNERAYQMDADIPADDEPVQYIEPEEILLEDPVVEEVVDTEQTSSGQTLTREFLERIPTGRSYRSTVQSAPAAAAPKPDHGRGERAPMAPPAVVAATTPPPSRGPPPPPPPPPPTGRTALVVTASPLTPALPLGTPIVTTTSALLPEGQHPTFSLRYRRTPGDPR